jgi:hypothetical protein
MVHPRIAFLQARSCLVAQGAGRHRGRPLSRMPRLQADMISARDGERRWIYATLVPVTRAELTIGQAIEKTKFLSWQDI